MLYVRDSKRGNHSLLHAVMVTASKYLEPHETFTGEEGGSNSQAPSVRNSTNSSGEKRVSQHIVTDGEVGMIPGGCVSIGNASNVNWEIRGGQQLVTALEPCEVN